MSSYNIEADAPSTTIPAPSAAAESAAPFAIVIVLSVTSKSVTEVEFISPVIFKLPVILKSVIPVTAPAKVAPLSESSVNIVSLIVFSVAPEPPFVADLKIIEPPSSVPFPAPPCKIKSPPSPVLAVVPVVAEPAVIVNSLPSPSSATPFGCVIVPSAAAAPNDNPTNVGLAPVPTACIVAAVDRVIPKISEVAVDLPALPPMSEDASPTSQPA